MLAVVKSLIVKLNSVAVNLSGLKVSRFYVLKRDSNVEPLKIKTKVNFNVRFINSTDIQELSEKCNIDFKQYLDRGNGGIVATIGNEIVSWALFAWETCYEDLTREKINLDSTSVYIYCVGTVPAYRGQGINPTLLDAIWRHLRAKGIQTFFVFILRENFSSIRSAYKAGFRSIGAVHYFEAFKLRLYRIKANAKTDYETIQKMFSTRQKK